MNIKGLPAYQGSRSVIKKDHDVYDIVREVCNAHDYFSRDYDKIAMQFWAGSLKRTCDNLFSFCKNNFVYRVEPGGYQTTRSPAAIFSTGKKIGVDCKHYALFIAGVLDALRRSGCKIRWCFRFASYDPANNSPEHVFVVIWISGKEYYVDPVLNFVNQRSPLYYYKIDKKIDMLERISGVGTVFSGGGGLFNKEPLDFIPVTPEPVIVNNLPENFKPVKNYLPWILAGGIILYFIYNKKNKQRGK